MKKKVLLLITVIISVLTLTSCNKNKDALLFKEDYESLNGQTTASGKEHRTLNIPENNPFVITTAKDIIDKIENKETFYVYFGSKLCPWCRSSIEKAIEVANDKDIQKIYYVDVWDDEGNEILRDKYTLDDNGNAVLVTEGKEEYFKLLSLLADVLPDYTYAANKNGGAKLSIEEKRIYLPTYIYVANGKPVRITGGLSDLQTGSRDELTKEILSDEENLFNNFFISTCDDNC